jgi:hypothetical protein
VYLSHQGGGPFDQVSIVQMENNAASDMTNVRRKRDSEIGPVVNPHDIAALYPFQKGTKYSLKHHPMEGPWKLKKIVAKTVIASQVLKHEYGFWSKTPCVVS